ncbi:MAG: F0F1 ATP synthase subunit B [Melioribacteraceae bacterium]|nr:F0F1 ATP synthase subunit B [Melioribacteraceae bacterium]
MANPLIAFAVSSGESSGGLLDVNPGLIVWTGITFLLLLYMLFKMAWKPILNSLNEREQSIKDSLEKADKAREEAQKIFEENKSDLAKAEAEARKIIAQGREYSEKIKEQMLTESKQQAQKMIDEAKAEIDRKNQEALNKLKEQVVSLAVNASEKIIRESLDKEKHGKIVEKYLEDLSKN